MEFKFEFGDRVEVLDDGFVCGLYKEAADTMGSLHYQHGKIPQVGDTGCIVNRSFINEQELYLVRINNVDYVFKGHEGLIDSPKLTLPFDFNYSSFGCNEALVKSLVRSIIAHVEKLIVMRDFKQQE